jgi:hypothetical protein
METAYFPPRIQQIKINDADGIADTGATSVFVKEGVLVANKRPAIHPITFNLPYGRKVKSTHTCDVVVPGLPHPLVGHIIPNMAIALLFGIRPLCNAGCIVVFDKDKCDVSSEVQSKMIIVGHQILSCHVPVVRSFFIL